MSEVYGGQRLCQFCGRVLTEDREMCGACFADKFAGAYATPPTSQESAGEVVAEALEGIDIAKLESLGWQIALCPVCGMSASAFKPDPRIATLTAELAAARAEVERLREALPRIADSLRKAGASLPAPENKGTVESAMQTGLSIALLLVEDELAALSASGREGE